MKGTEKWSGKRLFALYRWGKLVAHLTQLGRGKPLLVYQNWLKQGATMNLKPFVAYYANGLEFMFDGDMQGMARDSEAWAYCSCVCTIDGFIEAAGVAGEGLPLTVFNDEPPLAHKSRLREAGSKPNQRKNKNMEAKIRVDRGA